jgi:hypothetical protein
MTDILEELFKTKTKDGKEALQVSGLSFIHPMHEAAIAFFRKNITPGYICQMFATDENSLRKAIALEVLVDNLDQPKKEQILAKLGTGANLNQIVELTALSYAEGRRIVNGNVLKEVHVPSDSKGKYLLEAIRQGKVNPLYIENSKAENLDAQANSIREKRVTRNIIKYGVMVALASSMAIALYFNVKNNREYVTRINNLEKGISAYSSIVKQMPDKEQKDFVYKYQELTKDIPEKYKR